MRRQPRISPGFTLVELVVVLVLIAVFAALILPALTSTRHRSGRIVCVSNLKQIGLGTRIFSAANGNRTPMQVWTNHTELALTNELPPFFYGKLFLELGRPKVLVCPSDVRVATQGWGTLSASNVSYFIGLQADEMHPQRILGGDRNLTTNGVALSRGLHPMATTVDWGWGVDMHRGVGNVVLADGSVQILTPQRLGQQVQVLGSATNWLAVP